MSTSRVTVRGFSLIELVMVVVIIGIIGAIAVPRLSRGSTGAAEAALAQNLAILTQAVELYKAEHLGKPPTTKAQLTKPTDEAGNTNDTKVYPYIYGPYLLQVPRLPIGTNKGENDIVTTGNPGDSGGAGWWIDPNTGDVRANAPDSDLTSDGVQINTIKGGQIK